MNTNIINRKRKKKEQEREIESSVNNAEKLRQFGKKIRFCLCFEFV